MLRRATHSDVRVGGCLEGSQTIADDEDGGAEATKALCDDAWYRDDGAESIEEQAEHKGGLVAPVSQNPGCMTQTGEEVGTVEAESVHDGS